MSDRLLVAALGNRNSGKSTTWNNLFEATVKTGKQSRSLYLNRSQSVEVFLISGSPQERKVDVETILNQSLPKIVLCSTQYHSNAIATIDHFFQNGYDIFVQWLNPGFSDSSKYTDSIGIQDYLLNLGATLQVRNGQIDPSERLKDIRQFILGWATYRNLLHTDFPS